MSASVADDAVAARAALEALSRVYQEAVSAVGSIADPQVRLECTSTLAGALREYADAGSTLRAQAARAIWDSEKMTLRVLADRLGVSTQRADQILKSTRTKEAEKNG